jgi:Kef-type K+ transport system membrane component KefB
MFRPLLHVLALRKLGLTRLFRFLALAIFLGCLIAGLIYAAVVFHAVTESNHAPHVQPHSSH